jgi:hypothetical protein
MIPGARKSRRVLTVSEAVKREIVAVWLPDDHVLVTLNGVGAPFSERNERRGVTSSTS